MEERTLRVLEFDKIKDRLISLCTCELGKELAAEMLPRTESEEVERMLRETTDAVDFILRRGSPPLGGIHDIRDTLRRAEIGTVLNPGELLRVADTLRAVRSLKNYASEDSRDEEGNISHIGSLIASLTPNRRTEDNINAAIVSEEEIADNASSTLANTRRRIREKQNSIKEKLNSMIHSEKYRKFMQESLVTIRGDRYVIPIKAEYRSEFPGLVHDSSASGATVYIEPMAVVEANNSIRELKIKEQHEIERILQELTSEVAGFIDQLKVNVAVFAQLDFAFAKAKLSLDLNCVCPKLNRKKRINIKRAGTRSLTEKPLSPSICGLGTSSRSWSSPARIRGQDSDAENSRAVCADDPVGTACPGRGRH